MFKKLIPLVLISIITLGLVGCFNSGGSTGPTDSEINTVKTEINTYRDAFATAVGNFDANGMLAHFNKCDPNTNFVLTIAEAGSSYQKHYAVLEPEVHDVADLQNGWHLDNDIKYNLNLTFVGDMTFHIDSSIHGTGSQHFEVHESASGTRVTIPDTLTDSGLITIEVTNLLGTWTITHMTIAYDDVPTPTTSTSLRSLASSNGKGFGFGQKSF